MVTYPSTKIARNTKKGLPPISGNASPTSTANTTASHHHGFASARAMRAKRAWPFSVRPQTTSGSTSSDMIQRNMMNHR